MSKHIAALATKGHSSAQGGLRGHSIGALYPYSVDPVYAKGFKFIGWTVRNLLSGEDFLPGNHTYDQPGTFRMAHGFAKALKEKRDSRLQIERVAACLRGEGPQFPVVDRRGWADAF